MVKINSSDYPKKRSWETKVFAMPNIPRGEKGFPESLKHILNTIKNNEPSNSSIEIPGSNSKSSLENLYISLRPSGFVNKLSTGWEVSLLGEKWLETKDNLYLAAILNANIKFFSEILHLIESGYQQTKLILEYANDNYYLNWRTKSEVLARLNWLRDLSFISYEDFTYKYYLTEQGREFLTIVGYLDPNEIKSYKDTTKKETEVNMSKWAWEMCKLDEETKLSRKTGIGYIPGSIQNIHQTILEYLRMMNQPTEYSTIFDYSSATYEIAESSTRAFISTLINANLIERKTKTLYETSNLGKRFPTDNFELDFACCLNSYFSFFFEILFELQKEHLTARELAVTAKVSYDFPSEDPNEINKRLHVLKNAQLLREISVDKYSLTHRGELFTKKLEPFYRTEAKEIKEQIFKRAYGN